MNEELIERHKGLVDKLAARFEPDEELIQVGMIALWEAAEKWDRAYPFQPWARTVIYHRMIDHTRRKKPEEEELTENVAAEEEPGDETEDELRRRIGRAFPRRSREYKILCSLLAGKPKESIARRMGVTRQTVDRIARQAWCRLQAEKERRE